MAYSELVKNFERVRDYMRAFYVYGFKSREEYDEKSARSYDNERRRIESWLGEFMSFHRDAAGKSVFLSVDSRSIPRNPLHKAFKAKSFTAKDITLHFYLLDILAPGQERSLQQIVRCIHEDYLSRFDGGFSVDESTVRKKLKEYERLGLVCGRRCGREVFYRRADDTVDLASWEDALAFFSEEHPLGVVGSFLMDRTESEADPFRFKHHYMLHALDSEILFSLLQAIDAQCAAEIEIHNLRSGRDALCTVCPLKIYISTQTGRQYLLAYHYGVKKPLFYRIDAIKKVTIGSKEKGFADYLEVQRVFDRRLWGVSGGDKSTAEHIEMTLRFGDDEEFIPQRLEREKRHGHVERIDAHTCRFTADVYDASEMLPWLRTFIGRVADLQCSNPEVTRRFYEDLAQMRRMYGGEEDAVQ